MRYYLRSSSGQGLDNGDMALGACFVVAATGQQRPMVSGEEEQGTLWPRQQKTLVLPSASAEPSQSEGCYHPSSSNKRLEWKLPSPQPTGHWQPWQIPGGAWADNRQQHSGQDPWAGLNNGAMLSCWGPHTLPVALEEASRDLPSTPSPSFAAGLTMAMNKATSVNSYWLGWFHGWLWTISIIDDFFFTFQLWAQHSGVLFFLATSHFPDNNLIYLRIPGIVFWSFWQNDSRS